MFLLDFCGDVNREEATVMRLSCNEDYVIVAWVILTEYQRVTDGQMDGFTIASTVLCITRHADSLYKWK